MADSKELRAIVGAMTERPWRQEYAWNNGGMPTSEFFIPGHNGGASVEMLAADAEAIVALANHADALVELVAACERLRSGPHDDFVLSKINRALMAVHAVGKEPSDG